jgi:hypothetical protein
VGLSVTHVQPHLVVGETIRTTTPTPGIWSFCSKEAQLAELERARNEEDTDVLQEDDDPLVESPAAAAERVRRFNLIKELLTATTFGTS